MFYVVDGMYGVYLTLMNQDVHAARDTHVNVTYGVQTVDVKQGYLTDNGHACKEYKLATSKRKLCK